MATDNDTDCSTISADTIKTIDSSTDNSCNSASKTQKKLAQKQSRILKKKEKENKKKKQKNKISKDDFYNKSLEFKAWLSEKKNLNADMVSPKRSRELFKKFVSKWNRKKLPKHYYRGVDNLWAIGSPLTQSSWAVPNQVDVTHSTPPSVEMLSDKYSRTPSDEAVFGTFGKKSGSRLLQRLREYNNRMSYSASPDAVKETFSKTNTARRVETLHKSEDTASPQIVGQAALGIPSYTAYDSDTSDSTQITDLELDNNVPMQDTPEYLGCVRRRRRYQSADMDARSLFEMSSTATISQPWAAMRNARCLSKYSLASDWGLSDWKASDTLSLRSLSPARSMFCIPTSTPAVPSLYTADSCLSLDTTHGSGTETEADTAASLGEAHLDDTFEAHDADGVGKTSIKPKKKKKKKKEKAQKKKKREAQPDDAVIYDTPVPVCVDAAEARDDEADHGPLQCKTNEEGSVEKKRRMSKKDSYVTRIENTSNAMFEKRQVGPGQCTQRTPVKSSSHNDRTPATVTRQSVKPSTKPVPPLRTSKVNAYCRQTSNENVVPLSAQENIPPNKQSQANPNVTTSGHKPSTPRCEKRNSQMVIKTPAGVFLVTKLDGPVTDLPLDVNQSLSHTGHDVSFSMQL